MTMEMMMRAMDVLQTAMLNLDTRALWMMSNLQNAHSFVATEKTIRLTVSRM